MPPRRSAAAHASKSISFIGAGRLTVSLGRLWHQLGVLAVRDVYGRSGESARDAVAAIGAGTAVVDPAQLDSADLFLIATPDRAVVAATERLVDTGLVGPGTIVFHCSGAENSGLLEAARSKGAVVASAHPLTSFSGRPVRAEEFAGVYCTIEGEPAAAAAMREIFSAIGAKPVDIAPAQKILYHAAAVMASNYVVTLLQVALDTLAMAGIRSADGLAMLEPLVRQTVENLFRQGPRAALTGPIARGDLELVRRQFRSLETADPAIAALYRALGERAAQLAGSRDPFASPR